LVGVGDKGWATGFDLLIKQKAIQPMLYNQNRFETINCFFPASGLFRLNKDRENWTGVKN
jgi:hypothetical protein